MRVAVPLRTQGMETPHLNLPIRFTHTESRTSEVSRDSPTRGEETVGLNVTSFLSVHNPTLDRLPFPPWQIQHQHFQRQPGVGIPLQLFFRRPQAFDEIPHLRQTVPLAHFDQPRQVVCIRHHRGLSCFN